MDLSAFAATSQGRFATSHGSFPETASQPGSASQRHHAKLILATTTTHHVADAARAASGYALAAAPASSDASEAPSCVFSFSDPATAMQQQQQRTYTHVPRDHAQGQLQPSAQMHASAPQAFLCNGDATTLSATTAAALCGSASPTIAAAAEHQGAATNPYRGGSGQVLWSHPPSPSSPPAGAAAAAAASTAAAFSRCAAGQQEFAPAPAWMCGPVAPTARLPSFPSPTLQPTAPNAPYAQTQAIMLHQPLEQPLQQQQQQQHGSYLTAAEPAGYAGYCNGYILGCNAASDFSTPTEILLQQQQQQQQQAGQVPLWSGLMAQCGLTYTDPLLCPAGTDEGGLLGPSDGGFPCASGSPSSKQQQQQQRKCRSGPKSRSSPYIGVSQVGGHVWAGGYTG